MSAVLDYFWKGEGMEARHTWAEWLLAGFSRNLEEEGALVPALAFCLR